MSDKKCTYCKKPFTKEGSVFISYWIYKGLLASMACSNCWNENQDQYKKECDYILKFRESDGGQGTEALIWISCKETGCNKNYDPQSIEALRHNPKKGTDSRAWGGGLSFDEHQELNKNPNPVNSLEELIQQWMESNEYQRIYRKGSGHFEYIVVVDKDGNEEERAFDDDGKENWSSKLGKHLKLQPNYEIVRKKQDNPNGPNNPNPNNNLNNLTILTQIQAFFQANSIKSITKQPNGDLLIKFENNNPEQTINEQNNSQMDQEQKEMWRKFKEFTRNRNITTLDRQQLEQLIQQEQQRGGNPNKTDWTPWIIGGSVVGAVVIIGIVIGVMGSRKKKPKIEI